MLHGIVLSYNVYCQIKHSSFACNLFAEKLYNLLVTICHKQSHHGSIVVKLKTQRLFFFNNYKHTQATSCLSTKNVVKRNLKFSK